MPWQQVIKAPESARFYDAKTATPILEVIGSTTGKPRNPTIKDAKKNGWLPSVTSIIRIVASHELNAWKEDNILKVAIKAIRNPEESDKDFANRISEEADLVGKIAAERGTIIHAGISQFFKNQIVSEDVAIKNSCENIISSITALEAIEGCKAKIITDLSFVNIEHQFGGSCDMILEFENGRVVIIDFKTTDLDEKYKPYFSYKLQLGGYHLGVYPKKDFVEKAIVAVDKTEGKIKWFFIEERNLVDLFKCANALWRASNRF